ncbi:hypothetical protein [Hymenobacter sp. GOD-10R]|uniref:hypothetical protein n=1 Tax=Hymenobacter sp. GOD-10R TaxID=3093922 RepID=UPI002D79F67C|nr:hypothetical protein [Hymenobacter sp. GOD-10R]WRQ26673.1 hypothetical protein SD425_16495 [Hymenobacter sp. GOD-10R]
MAVNYTEELLAQAESWASTPLTEKRSPAGLATLAALYSALTGTAAGSCRQCQFSDYNAAVTSYIRQAQRILHPETVAKQTYTLAPGFENQTFVHEQHAKVVSAENLTDKDAEFFIENGYGHAFLKDGKAIATEGAKDEQAEAPKLTEKEQAQADYKAAFGEEADPKLTIKQLKAKTAQREAELEAEDTTSSSDTGATDATGDSTGPSDVDPK